VSLKLAPQPTLGAAAAGMLSVDGRCKTWDARANGYVRSEGVGCTVVAPGGEGAAGVGLLGLAVRQDGRSASLTAPNGSAQRALLHAALEAAGVAAAGVARLEAHGTGTALGDPTEAGSLVATLCGSGSGRASPLAVGAAKASIGHGEAASGQSGLQRLAAALGRLSSGGNAQLRRLNPLVGELWKGAAAALSTQPVRWVAILPVTLS
jgi:acyl transferase domain-containing protein